MHINLEVKYKQVRIFDTMGVLLEEYSTTIEPKQKDTTPKFDSKLQKGLISMKKTNFHRFVKVFKQRTPPFQEIAYLGYYYKLLQTVAPETNNISKKGVGNKYIDMSRTDIQEYLNISARTCKTFITTAKNIGAIAEVLIDLEGVKHKSFCLNPAYAINGVYLHSYLFEVFQHNKDFQDYISDYQAIQLEEIRPILQVQ